MTIRITKEAITLVKITAGRIKTSWIHDRSPEIKKLGARIKRFRNKKIPFSRAQIWKIQTLCNVEIEIQAIADLLDRRQRGKSTKSKGSTENHNHKAIKIRYWTYKEKPESASDLTGVNLTWRDKGVSGASAQKPWLWGSATEDSADLKNPEC